MTMAVEVSGSVGGGGGGGGTLSEIYQGSKRLLLKARDGMERLERLEFSSSGGVDSPELSLTVKRDISEIQSLCVEMDRLWRSVAVKSQRDLWRRKVEQVAEEADSLKESLDKYHLRNQKRMMEAKERAELLGRTSGDSAHVLRIFDDEAQAMQSARNSSMLLEEMNSVGVAIVSKYAEQRDHLKDQINCQWKCFATLVDRRENQKHCRTSHTESVDELLKGRRYKAVQKSVSEGSPKSTGCPEHSGPIQFRIEAY